MSLETFAREYWLASSFLKGRKVPRPMNRLSAESCLRKLAIGCRWAALRRAAGGSIAIGVAGPVAKARLLPVKVNETREWVLPCDTEPEAAP